VLGDAQYLDAPHFSSPWGQFAPAELPVGSLKTWPA
jgi:hypothetical protein